MKNFQTIVFLFLIASIEGLAQNTIHHFAIKNLGNKFKPPYYEKGSLFLRVNNEPMEYKIDQPFKDSIHVERYYRPLFEQQSILVSLKDDHEYKYHFCYYPPSFPCDEPGRDDNLRLLILDAKGNYDKLLYTSLRGTQVWPDQYPLVEYFGNKFFNIGGNTLLLKPNYDFSLLFTFDIYDYVIRNNRLIANSSAGICEIDSNFHIKKVIRPNQSNNNNSKICKSNGFFLYYSPNKYELIDLINEKSIKTHVIKNQIPLHMFAEDNFIFVFSSDYNGRENNLVYRKYDYDLNVVDSTVLNLGNHNGYPEISIIEKNFIFSCYNNYCPNIFIVPMHKIHDIVVPNLDLNYITAKPGYVIKSRYLFCDAVELNLDIHGKVINKGQFPVSQFDVVIDGLKTQNKWLSTNIQDRGTTINLDHSLMPGDSVEFSLERSVSVTVPYGWDIRAFNELTVSIPLVNNSANQSKLFQQGTKLIPLANHNLSFNSLNVFPNPTYGNEVILGIDNNDIANSDVKIFDSNGKNVICKSEPTSVNKIRLIFDPQIKRGIYFIQVRNNQKIINSKFLLN